MGDPRKGRVDRIACPWLITRSSTGTDVPLRAGNQVMAVAEREGAIPYDVRGWSSEHVGEHCSFDAFLGNTSSRIRHSARSPSSCAVRTPTRAS